MKKCKKLILTACAVAALLGCTSASVMAASYTYTVTFYAGAQGTFAGQEGLSCSNSSAVITQTTDKIVITGLKQGDEVSFNPQTENEMTLEENSKYYVKGIRLSGRDNDSVSSSAIKVDGDVDYVVAYGIKGNMVSYTVNYQDSAGNTLAASDTFYGNIGDKPVVAYRYIEGYVPQYRGITKTLSEDAADNVFTFVYTAATEAETVVEESTTVVTQTQDVLVPGTAAGTGTTGTGAGTAGNAGGAAGGAADGNEVEVPDEEVPLENQDILDLDDEETPSANQDLDSLQKGFPLAGMVGIGIAALAAIVILIAKLRKRSDEENEE
jgi:hypothetical protein